MDYLKQQSRHVAVVRWASLYEVATGPTTHSLDCNAEYHVLHPMAD